MKRKAPSIGKAGVMKLINNSRTPPGLKSHWRKVAKTRGYIK